MIKAQIGQVAAMAEIAFLAMKIVVAQVVFKKTKVFMEEEIVYSNVQAKSCTGNCTYKLCWQYFNPLYIREI